MADLSKLHRELISRGAMLVLSLALLYGGYRCVKAGSDVQDFVGKTLEEQRPSRRARSTTNRGSTLLYLAGGVLFLGGGVFGMMAVVPANTFARLMGPPDLSHYN